MVARVQGADITFVGTLSSPVSMRPIIGRFVLLSIVIIGCRTAQRLSAPNPGEQYRPLPVGDLPASVITVPITLSVRDLLVSLNQRVQGLLYEDNSFSDNGNDGLMLRVWRARPFDLSMANQVLRYRVPLKIWAKQQVLFGAVEAEGELELGLKTTFSLQPDWSLRTQTAVEFHEWLSSPVLKTRIGDLNIQPLASFMLNQSKNVLTQALDRFIAQQLSLRPYAEMAWETLQKPILLDSAQQLWVKTTPIAIRMTPLLTVREELRTTLSITGYNEVFLGQRPTFRPNSALPNLEFSPEAAEGFQLRISTQVSFAEAERLAREVIVGQRFSSGKKQVTVQNLRLWGNGDRLVVNTTLRGFFNGDIYLIGKPVLNLSQNRIEVAELAFHAETRNFLHRTAAWLFSGAFEKRIGEALQFPLEENLRDLRNAAQQTLQRYEIRPGIVLSGSIDTLAVERTLVTPVGLRADLYATGRVHLNLSGL